MAFHQAIFYLFISCSKRDLSSADFSFCAVDTLFFSVGSVFKLYSWSSESFPSSILTSGFNLNKEIVEK